MAKTITPEQALELLNGKPTVTGTQAAQILGISHATVARQIKAGTFPLPHLQIGGRYVIPSAPLLQLITGKQAA